MAYTLSQRTREMGVRIAIGASAQDIIRLIVGDGLRVVAWGAAIGVVLAMVLGSLVASVLYAVSPYDARVLVAAITVLMLSAGIACSIPA